MNGRVKIISIPSERVNFSAVPMGRRMVGIILIPGNKLPGFFQFVPSGRPSLFALPGVCKIKGCPFLGSLLFFYNFFI
jgi:hypothetical protein